MSNQMIGITGVFALTLFLLILRHCFLALGRVKRSGNVTLTLPRASYEFDTKTGEDDSWLLWTSDETPRGDARKHASV